MLYFPLSLRPIAPNADLGVRVIPSSLRNHGLFELFASEVVSPEFTGERLLLLAESAHVMPPIGAQGLNCSIQDIKILTDIIALKVKGDKDFGSKDVLHSYESARGNQIRSRMLGIHVLNKVSMHGNGLTLAIRKLGLRALSKNLDFRKIVMNLGMYEKFNTII